MLDMAKELELHADEDQIKRIIKGKMTIEDFYAQVDSADKMGLQNVIESLGMSGAVNEGKIEEVKASIEKWRFIIQSMTKVEKEDPEAINESRRKRIARGSGRSEGDFKDLIRQYRASKDLMKHNKGRDGFGSFFRKFGGGKPS